MPAPACAAFSESVADLVAGSLAPEVAARMHAHADACPPCARERRRERRLVAWLTGPDGLDAGCGAPPAPPAVPARPAGRIAVLRRTAAVAAAVLVASAAWFLLPLAETPERDAASAAVAAPDDLAPADRWLSSAAGPEALVARRAAGGR